MSRFYIVTFIFLVYFQFLFSELRWLIHDKINSICSRTYLRKNHRGFKNKLFFTSLKDRCNLGPLYILNKLMIYCYAIVGILSLCFGWIEFVQIPLKWAMTSILTILTGRAILIYPQSSRGHYDAIPSKRDTLEADIHSIINTIISEAIAIGGLIAWFHYA